MKAARVHTYGNTGETLVVEEAPDPVPGPGQVLIENHASSVNPIDWKLGSGKMRLIMPLKFPAILGFDVAGRVKAVGTDVTRFRIGDEVYSRAEEMPGNACAEFIALDESIVVGKPQGMSFQEAAALPLAGLTAFQALRDKGGLAPGQSVLINGASGGVGLYAVQIAKAMEARVVAVCSAANAELVRSVGADEVLDYKTVDPLEGKALYDVIFDCVSALSYGKAKRRLAAGGTFVNTMPRPDIILAGIFSAFSRKKAATIMVKSSGPDLEELRGMVEAGKLKSVIDSEFSLDDVAKAHERSLSGRARGKIVVKIR